MVASRTPNRRAAVALAAGLAALSPGGTARCADDPPVRAEPQHAPIPVEVGGDYPSVGARQKVEIARDVLRSSARELARHPGGGAIGLFGRLGERTAVRLRGALREGFSSGPGHTPGAPAGPHDLGGHGGPPTPARLEFIPDSGAAIDALVGLIESATVRVDLMMYPWQDDPTGRRVAEALERRARQGVRVRLLVDRGGILMHNPAAARGEFTVFDRLRAVPNLDLIQSTSPFLRFDHRKLAVVDGRVAWSGSAILTDVGRSWRNFQYLAEGPIVDQLACVFEARWREMGGEPAPPLTPTTGPSAPPNATVRLLQTDLGADRSLKEAIYHAVDHARHRIYLENPYFTDALLADKLVAASARGVDVRAILTIRGNFERINCYEALMANKLLRGGVRVYLYPEMTHVKAMSADGVWSYVGTGNFDELSLRNNREVGLSIAGPEAARAVDEALFLPGMAASRELTSPLPPPRRPFGLELFSLWY